ncbi:MAG: hypothetical protein ACJAXU_002482, partial [Paracoccaceae bacterium]
VPAIGILLIFLISGEPPRVKAPQEVAAIVRFC